MHRFTTIVIMLAVSAFWISLWSSTSPVPVSDAEVTKYLKEVYIPGNQGLPPIMARGGFPLPAFKYPVSPLGDDTPNDDAMFPAVLNMFFWLALAGLVLWPVPRRLLTVTVERYLSGLAALTTIFGIVFLLIKFD